MLGASLVIHEPCAPQPQRDDGVCEKCFFRLHWQSGNRREDAGDGSTVTILPLEQRSWRNTGFGVKDSS